MRPPQLQPLLQQRHSQLARPRRQPLRLLSLSAALHALKRPRLQASVTQRWRQPQLPVRRLSQPLIRSGLQLKPQQLQAGSAMLLPLQPRQPALMQLLRQQLVTLQWRG